MNEQQQLLTRFLMAPSQQYDKSHKRRIDHHFNDDINFKPAAVLIPLVPRKQGFNVVLTRRAEHLKHHPGQIAFPGGRFEETDNDLITTALRETYEETGIICQRNNVIGQLTPLVTTSGYIVTPFISTISSNYNAKPDPGEVDAIFEVPLNYLLDPQNIKSHQFHLRGEFHRVYAIPYNNYSIWGATAQMIKLLSNQIWEDKK
ncbi:CoA pyrophosphatase [Photobacterium aquimaris]|uniref:CoA pyrophosphatase n=1 Tax=Photobacterium aquimaris TaxID=512643 RepID=A0A1B8I5R9_9GAMM|nr:CoA pyrophosphatase [Photobacterium aquimaris]MCP4957396.1 CoA pyrophosphatase [Photobacterium aquimaris]OBU26473.1 coenzyme A pyrophosphatase [Photobacterium aquimaris]PQJ40779.1 CoA pyrophosphatase [Photobacterium aquimaris]PSU12142.1 CoA pyrophosphatase [Photobacterium aquimaris]SMY15194.1 putative NUDIX hydrolase [Photobacterium aquimaris]